MSTEETIIAKIPVTQFNEGDEIIITRRIFLTEHGEKRDTGGRIKGPGFEIALQDGPLSHLSGEGRNGAIPPDLLMAVRALLEHFQDGPMRCRETACAITKIQEAEHWLAAREVAVDAWEMVKDKGRYDER